MSRRILVADDSSTIQKVIKIAFSRFAVEMVEASSFLEALSAVDRAEPDLLIADASLPGSKGPDDFMAMSKAARSAPVLLLFGTYDAVDEAAFRQAGFPHFLKKPFESADLIALADRLLGGDLTRGGGADESGYEPPSPTAPSAPGRAAHTAVIYAPGTFPVESTNSRSTMPPGPPPGRSRDGGPPPPPEMTSGRGRSPMPSIPAPPGFNLESLSAPPEDEDDDDIGIAGGLGSLGMPPPAAVDESQRGRRVFSPENAESTADRMPFGGGSGSRSERTFDLSQPPGAATEMPRRAGSSGSDSESGNLESTVSKLLPALVREMLEDYCERHFKSLARDVIATELRRLADEKARHLVDN